jgi:predicted TIM-barrel fold metal-dependent hydrolase
VIVDSQLHVWDRDRSDLPWKPPPHDANEAATRRRMEEHVVTYGTMSKAMEEAGVAAALLATAGGIYANDNRYAFHAATEMPDRFAVVARLDHRDEDVSAHVRELAVTRGCVGIRVAVFTAEQVHDWEEGRMLPLLAAATENGLPVCIYPPLLLESLPSVVKRLPGLRLVIDHLGVRQPPLLPPGADGLAELPALLTLADCAGLYVKVTGLHDLSRRPPPFADLQETLRTLAGAFGADRLMWGSDWTRDTGRFSYGETVSYVLGADALTQAERELVLGGTLRTVFGWP